MTQEDPDTAGLIARNLLCQITGKSKEQFLADRELYAGEETCREMEKAIGRVLNGEPLAYILGCWEFYGVPLVVSPDVLIPRDDTCAVTELAIRQARNMDHPRVLDLCTGSGCIGIAIAMEVPEARVTCGDISREALKIAEKNVAAHKLEKRITCREINACEKPWQCLGKFDIIVSNPPYITTEEMAQLPDSVKNYEPHMALHGGDDGFIFYRAISELYREALKPGGYLCFEFGMGQGDDVCSILQMNGYTILERTRDYNERERAVIACYNRKE